MIAGGEDAGRVVGSGGGSIKLELLLVDGSEEFGMEGMLAIA